MIMQQLVSDIPDLVTQGGQATAVGIWILMAITVGLIVLMGYRQFLGVKVAQKELKAPPPQAPQLNPQPFLVAMEKEFVHLRDYNAQVEDLKNQDTENRKYAHDEVHAIRGILQSYESNQTLRNERLAALEADSKTHTRQLASIDSNIGKLREDLGIQKGRTEGRSKT